MRRGDAGRRGPRARAARSPAPRPPCDHVYSEDVDPTSDEFDTERRRSRATRPPWSTCSTPACGTRWSATRASWCSARTWPTASREEALDEVKGKGGVFKVTAGLQREFGSDRVFNSPLAEANIVGRAIGMAHARAEAGGRDPVLRLHLAGVHADPQRARHHALALRRALDGARWSIRVDLRRLPQGRRDLPLADRRDAVHPHAGPARGAARRTPLDANGLLRTAIRCDDPVLFLEHKHLYRQIYNKGRVSRARLHDPLRQGEGGPGGHRPDRRHLRRRW